MCANLSAWSSQRRDSDETGDRGNVPARTVGAPGLGVRQLARDHVYLLEILAHLVEHVAGALRGIGPECPRVALLVDPANLKLALGHAGQAIRELLSRIAFLTVPAVSPGPSR